MTSYQPSLDVSAYVMFSMDKHKNLELEDIRALFYSQTLRQNDIWTLVSAAVRHKQSSSERVKVDQERELNNVVIEENIRVRQEHSTDQTRDPEI